MSWSSGRALGAAVVVALPDPAPAAPLGAAPTGAAPFRPPGFRPPTRPPGDAVTLAIGALTLVAGDTATLVDGGALEVTPTSG